MGICNSLCKSAKNKPKISSEQTFNNQRTYVPTVVEKKINPNAIIENVSNSTIIRSISEINGDAIKIEKCKDSTIIIMDYSAQVNINECTNCTFFIAPCRGSIYLNKCEKIKIISASSQFRCRDLSDSKISIYSTSKPAIERVKNLQLSCFCFMYTELPEMFSKADLSIWDNSWSEYTKFSQSTDPSHEIKYFEVNSDEEFMVEYRRALKDQEISLDQYYPIPFTHGMSSPINKDNNHMIVLLKEAYLDNSKMIELLKLELLNDLNIRLIRACTLEKGNKFIQDVESVLKINKNNKYEFFVKGVNNTNSNHNNNMPNSGASGNFSSNNNNNFNIAASITKNDYVLLWFDTEEENFDTYVNILDNELENFVYLLKQDLQVMVSENKDQRDIRDEFAEGNKKIKELLKMIFNDYDI
jgi:hypothetical protein